MWWRSLRQGASFPHPLASPWEKNSPTENVCNGEAPFAYFTKMREMTAYKIWLQTGENQTFLTLRWFNTELAGGDLGTQMTTTHTFFNSWPAPSTVWKLQLEPFHSRRVEGSAGEGKAVTGARNQGEPWLVRDRVFCRGGGGGRGENRKRQLPWQMWWPCSNIWPAWASVGGEKEGVQHPGQCHQHEFQFPWALGSFRRNLSRAIYFLCLSFFFLLSLPPP